MRELKRYKEEALAILIVSVLLLLVRWMSIHWLSTGHSSDMPNQYDLRSETETIVWTVLRLVIYTIASWAALRVIMPKGYTWLKHGIVDGFEQLNADQKTNMSTRMWAILFFGLVMLAMSGCNPAAANNTRQCVVSSGLYDVGVREATGRNDGVEVEKYLKHVGLPKGNAWCAAFVCYHLSECGVANPRSAWSPTVSTGGTKVWTPRKAVRDPMPGDVFAVYFPNLGRVGHVGIVTGRKGKYITTVEGNTSGPGSREGDGVYARRRELSKIHAVTNYITDEPTTARTTGAARPARLQGQTQHGQQHLGGGQHGGGVSLPRYADHNGARQHRTAHTALCSMSGRGTGVAPQWSRNDHGRYPGQRPASRLRVRHYGDQSTVARPAYQARPQGGREGEGRAGQVSYSLMDVDTRPGCSCRARSASGRAAQERLQHQVAALQVSNA